MFRKDPDVVMEAVKQDWRALAHAAPELRAARGIVLEAVRQSGEALKYAALALRKAVIESPKSPTLLFELLHEPWFLKIAKVLLADSRLLHIAHEIGTRDTRTF